MKTFAVILLTLVVSFPFSLKAQQPAAVQNLQLEEGYQLVSTYVDPDNPDLLELLEELLFDGSLEFVRNSEGEMFHKVGWEWVNNIGDWQTNEGYLFYMNDPATITIQGELYDPGTPLSLGEGFQFAAYYYTEPMDALETSAEILDNLVFIRNSDGNMLQKIGPNWVNNIGDFQYGQGYLVKMNASDELVYMDDTTFNCPSTFIDPRDGQEYEAVMIGEQCWMAENLNAGTMIYGPQQDNGIIEKYCYSNDSTFCDDYGGLYQWDEMMQYVVEPGVVGICPGNGGWHIPIDDEWKILEGSVDSLYGVGDPIWDTFGWRGFDAGKNLKSTSGWDSGSGTDLYGFTLLPSGYKLEGGFFIDVHNGTCLWTSNEDGPYTSWMRHFTSTKDIIARYNWSKEASFPVRCMKYEGI